MRRSYNLHVVHELGSIVGSGLTSEVFAYGPGRVAKVFFPWRSREKVEREFEVTQAVHAMGIPVPRAFELVRIGGRDAIVFERIDGVSMFEAVQQKPWTLFRAAHELANLHVEIHTHKAPAQLPTQRQQIQGWLDVARDLPESDRKAASGFADVMQGGDTLCHGDFHPANILYTSKGPVIIDWSAATRGAPTGDVARTSSLIRFAEVPEQTPAHMRLLLQAFRRAVHDAYLRRYFQLRAGSPRELAAWDSVQKAAKAAWTASRVLF